MKGRHIVLAVLLLLVLGAAFLVWRTEQNSKARWDNWTEEQTEAAVTRVLETFETENPDAAPLTGAQIADIRSKQRAKFKQRADVQREKSSLLSFFKAKNYDGQQTVAALMDAFDTQYDMRNETQRGSFSIENRDGELQKVKWTQADIEAGYPRAEWIQMLLDKGVTIDNFDAYEAYLNMREKLFKEEQRAAGNGQGTTQMAFVDSLIQRSQRIREAKRANPDMKSWATIGENVHPSAPGRMYVQRSETGASIASMSSSVTRDESGKITEIVGPQLSEKQRFDLLYRGIEPDGWEVVYVDEKGNLLSDASLPSRGAVREKLGIEPVPTPTAEPVPSDDAALEMPALLELSRQPASESADDAPDQVQDAARAAQEEFERVQEQTREWTTLSDAELAEEFEKLLTPQMPELPTNESVEAKLREQFELETDYRARLEQLEPARLQRAMETLNRHGEKKGLRKLKSDDAETAELIERFFGANSAERAAEEN